MIKAGTIVNDMCSHEDFIPTFAAAAGESQIVQKLRKGHEIGHRTYKVHLDGQNLLPFFKGDTKESPRKGFMYWSDDGDLVAIRVENWKLVFKKQEAKGFEVWQRDFSNLRFPNLYNLRADPFERGDESIFYQKWMADRISFKFRRRQSQPSGWQASRNFLHARNRQASTSTA